MLWSLTNMKGKGAVQDAEQYRKLWDDKSGCLASPLPGRSLESDTTRSGASA